MPKIGGPSSRPTCRRAYGRKPTAMEIGANYKADTGEGLYRRSMYTIWKRTALLLRCSCSTLQTAKPARQAFPHEHSAPSPRLDERGDSRRGGPAGREMMKEEGKFGFPVGHRIPLGHRPYPRSRDPQGSQVRVRAQEEGIRKGRGGAKAFVMQGSKPDPSLPATELAAYSATASICSTSTA